MKKLFSELSPAEVSWSISYVCIAWLGELGNGAIQTITGPMQPFLAYNLQTNTQTINLVWTLGFLGFLFGSLITSHIFTKYLVTSVRKLLFLSSVMLLTGLATLSLPFMNNMPLLLLARFFQFLSYGLFLTADSILLVFTLGPEKSRPFINALHFFISCGFLLGTFLVQHFPLASHSTSHSPHHLHGRLLLLLPPPHVPRPGLLHQSLLWGGSHGILRLLAVCHWLLMDFPSYEYHGKTLLSILHRSRDWQSVLAPPGWLGLHVVSSQRALHGGGDGDPPVPRCPLHVDCSQTNLSETK